MIPIPPAAYWDKVPWWAYLVIVFIMLGVLPFLIKVMAGGRNMYQMREQHAFNSQQLLDSRRDAFFTQLEKSRQEALNDAETERKRRLEVEEDRDNGWDKGRGMEDEAHYFRHEVIAVTFRFNTFLDLIREFIRGDTTKERVELIVSKMPEAKQPRPVTPLRDIQPKKPSGEYA